MGNKSKHTVWMTDKLWHKIERNYKDSDCTTRNEYIEKAVEFYSGYLECQNSVNYLVPLLSSVLEGYFGSFGDRMGRMLFKSAVEQCMGNHLLAADSDLDFETMEQLRDRAVNDVKRTNGQISFKEVLRFQKELD